MEKNVIEGFCDWAYGDNVVWTVLDNVIPKLEEPSWEIICDETPQVGDKKVLFVQKPFDEEFGNEFLSFYQSPLVYYNDFDEISKADISKCAFIRCKYEENIQANEFCAYIRVSVLEVIKISDIYKYYPEIITSERINYSCKTELDEIYEDESWYVAGWSAQGDLGDAIYVYKDSNGKRHLVMKYSFDYHKDIYYLGNIVES